MNTIDKNTLIRFIADDLPADEMKKIRQRIDTDKDWSDAVLALQSGLQHTEENLKAVPPGLRPPAYYWNSFNPRLNDRLEQRRRNVKRFRRWTFITAPALGMAALFLIFFKIPDDTELQPARDWLYSISAEDAVESLLNSKSLSVDDFLNSISLSDNETNGFDEYSISTSSESAESVYLEPIDEFQKLETSQQDEILKELSKTEFL